MFEVNNKETKTTSMTSFSCLYCWLWTYFTSCSSVSAVDLEQVSTGGVISFKQIALYVWWTSDDRSYLISLKIIIKKQPSIRVFRVVVDLVDSW